MEIQEIKNKENKRDIQWQPIIEMMIILVTVLGSTVPLYIHTDNKFHETIKEIQKEMKDFHGKLCAIEERNKK